jgi:tetratricopeptide (TPR) repeat protein
MAAPHPPRPLAPTGLWPWLRTGALAAVAAALAVGVLLIPPPPEPPAEPPIIELDVDPSTARALADIIVRAARPPPRTLAGPYLSARFAEQRGDWAAASSYMQWAARAAPGDLALTRHAMVLAAGSGALKQAARLARKTLDGDPPDAAPLERLILAVDALTRGEAEAAATYLDCAGDPACPLPASGDPADLPETLFARAAGAWQAGQSGEARVFAQLARALAPTDPLPALLLGEIHATYGQDAQALFYFETVPADDALYTSAQQAAADALTRLDRPAEAVAKLEALADGAGPEDRAQMFIQIGEIHRGVQDYVSAIPAYDRALVALEGLEQPEVAGQVRFLRAMAHDGAGDWPGAEADLVAALEVHPDDPHMLNYLGYSWADRGERLDEALEMLERAAEARPGDYHIIDSVGWARFRLGDWAGAVEALERAAALAPYDPVVADHLGDAYWRAGRRAEARVQWRRALSVADDAELAEAIAGKLARGLPPPGGVPAP